MKCDVLQRTWHQIPSTDSRDSLSCQAGCGALQPWSHHDSRTEKLVTTTSLLRRICNETSTPAQEHTKHAYKDAPNAAFLRKRADHVRCETSNQAVTTSRESGLGAGVSAGGDLRPSLWSFKDATYWKRVHFLLLPGMACPGIESPSLVRATSA